MTAEQHVELSKLHARASRLWRVRGELYGASRDTAGLDAELRTIEARMSELTHLAEPSRQLPLGFAPTPTDGAP